MYSILSTAVNHVYSNLQTTPQAVQYSSESLCHRRTQEKETTSGKMTATMKVLYSRRNGVSGKIVSYYFPGVT